MSERIPTIKVKTDEDHKVINATDHKEGDILVEKPSEEAAAILRKLTHAESIKIEEEKAPAPKGKEDEDPEKKKGKGQQPQ